MNVKTPHLKVCQEVQKFFGLLCYSELVIVNDTAPATAASEQLVKVPMQQK